MIITIIIVIVLLLLCYFSITITISNFGIALLLLLQYIAHTSNPSPTLKTLRFRDQGHYIGGAKSFAFAGSTRAWLVWDCTTQRVLSTYIIECRVSILGITIMIWGSISHNST